MSDYHEQTAYRREAMLGYALDWSHQPHPFKNYQHRLAEPLTSPRLPPARLFDLTLKWPPEALEPAPAGHAGDLSAVLLMSAGITAGSNQAEMPGLRAPASAGALYPAELYVTACGLEDLADGLYHFTPELPGLHPLWTESLAAAAALPLGTGPSTLTFVISAMYWRSMWKYRTRAYRYCLLDAGHMLANLELALAACGWTPRSTADFKDGSLGVFLGLASEEEGALCAVQAGKAPADPGPENPGLPPLDLQAEPLSARIGRDQNVLDAHAQGYLESLAPEPSWPRISLSKVNINLPAPQGDGPRLVDVIRQRRSRRNFLKSPLDEQSVSNLLASALPEAGPCQATVLLEPGDQLKSRTYRYLPGHHALAPLANQADARAAMAQASLGQLWVGQAALVLVLWADLETLTQQGGPRAYRHAMLAAGRAGQRLYLAATALGLGCCGVGAFYDRQVAQAASLPGGASPLYLLACGPVKGWPA